MNYNKIIDNKFKVLKENKRRGGDFHLVVGYWLLVISKLRKTNYKQLILNSRVLSDSGFL